MMCTYLLFVRAGIYKKKKKPCFTMSILSFSLYNCELSNSNWIVWMNVCLLFLFVWSKIKCFILYFLDRADFICEVCDIVFPKKSALEVHSRMHTGIKPYQCNICTKAFSIYGNLKRHLLIHTGERPYQCSHCSNSFNNSSHLKRHVKKKHTNENGIKLIH
jgi:uncharacterized Zn-finger protein